MEEGDHRIPYALYLASWVYGEGSVTVLEDNAEQIFPSEYRPEMSGRVFCPECKTPLSRAPRDTDVFTNSRTAHFRHRPAYRNVPCGLRTKRGAGLSYTSEEELRRAVQNSDLVIVGGWQKNPPDHDVDETDADAIFQKTQIVDPDGPSTEVPLGRHTGQRFFLPSKLSTVLAICRNFDKNLTRGFFFPDSQYASRLIDRLYDIALISESLPERSQLFFGRIRGVQRLSKRDKFTLISDEDKEVKVYTWPSDNDRKRILGRAEGRILLFFGKVYHESGSVIACKIDDWGAYSLLPEKYERFLPD